MLISIVIPVYNVAQYLQKCVDSVLNNDLADCEILLVDDGSTDGICPALCDEIALANGGLVRTIHQKNKGLGGARNTGLEKANGEYVLFLDGDDCLAKHCIASLKALVQEHHPDIVSFSFAKIDGSGNAEKFAVNTVVSETPFTLSEKPEFLLSLPAATVRLWKRELFLSSQIRFPDRVWYEDIRTTPKLFAEAKSICAINQCYYLYLQREGSIMNSASLARNGEILEAFDDLLGWFHHQGLWETYENELTKLAIDHILLAATVRVARRNPNHPLLMAFARYMKEHFPNYEKNPYYAHLPLQHKLICKLVKGNHYRMIRILFRIKDRNRG